MWGERHCDGEQTKSSPPFENDMAGLNGISAHGKRVESVHGACGIIEEQNGGEYNTIQAR